MKKSPSDFSSKIDTETTRSSKKPNFFNQDLRMLTGFRSDISEETKKVVLPKDKIEEFLRRKREEQISESTWGERYEKLKESLFITYTDLAFMSGIHPIQIQTIIKTGRSTKEEYKKIISAIERLEKLEKEESERKIEDKIDINWKAKFLELLFFIEYRFGVLLSLKGELSQEIFLKEGISYARLLQLSENPELLTEKDIVIIDKILGEKSIKGRWIEINPSELHEEIKKTASLMEITIDTLYSKLNLEPISLYLLNKIKRGESSNLFLQKEYIRLKKQMVKLRSNLCKINDRFRKKLSTLTEAEKDALGIDTQILNDIISGEQTRLQKRTYFLLGSLLKIRGL